MRLYWTCSVCGFPITADPHTIDDTGEDVCDRCCPHCTDPSSVEAVLPGRNPALGIVGHPGPTQDQAARAEAL